VSDIAWAAWLLVALVLFGAEALTLQFVLLYFGLGALVAAAVSPFADGVLVQGLVFAVSAVLLMVLTRKPLLAYAHRQRDVATNVDTITGRGAVVTIEIDNHANTGQIRVGSEYWTARTPGDDDPAIPSGAVVRVESVAGVTARVVRREPGVVIPKELQ
jgi:membrane protein implicated in regulation of membrane protease activity